MSKKLDQQDYIDAAKELDVPVAAIKAVVSVESRGNGFYTDGRPVILFERHIFRRLLNKRGVPTDLLELKHSDLVSKKAGGYQGGVAEHDRLERAARIHRESALESCSWGMFQILGMHWKALGYKTLQEFINAMYRNEASHLDSFVRYIKSTPAAHRSMKNLDWESLAIAYNGPAQKGYDLRLKEAFDRYSGA